MRHQAQVLLKRCTLGKLANTQIEGIMLLLVYIQEKMIFVSVAFLMALSINFPIYQPKHNM